MKALYTTKKAFEKQPASMRLASSHAIIFTLYFTQAYCISKLSNQCH